MLKLMFTTGAENNKMTRNLFTPCFAGFVQFDVRTGDIEANLASVKQGLKDLQPQSPGLVVLPELWATGFAYDRLEEMAAQTPFVLNALQAQARRYHIDLAGSLPEIDRNETTPKFFNTFFVTGPEGLRGKYRKQELFGPMAEPDHFAAGQEPQPIAASVGLLAALVCYDLRFPELARTQVTAGAGLLAVSAQWPLSRADHWQALIKARAIENQIFVIACNRSGETDGTVFGGQSMIVAPDGTVLAIAGNGREAAGSRLAPEQLFEVRNRFNTASRVAYRHDDSAKIVSLIELQTKIARYKAIGRQVVFTNGCFDLLHQGHVTYLQEARRQGDCLVVGLNSDSSVRTIKGPSRPVNSEQSRARVLAGLACVDHVILFDEETPLKLISSLLPDVLVKGADWPVDKIVGAAEVLAAGGRVANIPLVDNFSTTGIIDRIRTNHGE